MMREVKILVVEMGEELETRTVKCENPDEWLCDVEDILADLHRKHIPGYEYKGFTKDEVKFIESNNGTFVEPVYLNSVQKVNCTLWTVEKSL